MEPGWPTQLDWSGFDEWAHEKRRVLVTGGSGFIARALYKKAQELRWPWEFVALSRDDGKLRATRERYANVIGVVRADVADEYGMDISLAAVLPDVVIHAAASKHVDLSEFNAWDTYRVNVAGTANVAKAAWRCQTAKTVVMISTDKACQPVNTYGATKFLGERLWQEAAQWDDNVEWRVARYGNVIGSTGSALPRFRGWAKEGKKVQVTNPDHTRFWLPVYDAVHCLLTAVGEGLSGELVVPTYLRSSTLLEAVIAATGSAENVELMGERPGEKMHEMILTEREATRARTEKGYAFVPPPSWTTDMSELSPALESAEPWAGHISLAEIAGALNDAEGV